MDIVIGKLGNQPFPIREQSVSRKHAILSVDETTGKMVLRDTNSVNGTYVLHNGTFKRVSTIQVNPETIVRVGAVVSFKVSDLLKKKEPKAIDISKLRYVYDNYLYNKMDIEAKMGKINMLRILAISGSGIVATLLFTALPSNLFGDAQTTTIIKAVFSLVLIVVSYLIVNARNNALIRRKYNNEEYFKRKYRCPKCGYSFGQKIYDNLIAEGKCPNPSCKCKFTEKK